MSWTEQYRVGHPEIDRQHQALFGLIDRLDAPGADADGADIDVMLELIEYVVQHFSFEAELMARYGYPEAPAHLAAHRELTAQAEALRNRFSNGEETASQLRELIDGWIKYHIGENDHRLAAFLAGRT